MNAPFPVFLTAYDPAELPGGTVDPLGFTAVRFTGVALLLALIAAASRVRWPGTRAGWRDCSIRFSASSAVSNRLGTTAAPAALPSCHRRRDNRSRARSPNC